MAYAEDMRGFTLIELSIVLVIIGLIVGGILVGQDLIKAAEVRSQVSQIEKYNSAVNTFRSKFNALPGDMAVSVANQFGFTPGASCDGSSAKRDGNGLIEGWTSPWTQNQGIGETALFWSDISNAVGGSLIEGQFPNNGAPATGCTSTSQALTLTLGTSFVGDYYPLARIGHGNFVYVYSDSGYNWFGLLAVAVQNASAGWTSYNETIPVIQAYNMDKKIDDGLPTTGAVLAYYTHGGPTVLGSPNAASDTTTTCYNTSSNVYSIGSAANYGNGGNCAISFRFQ